MAPASSCRRTAARFIPAGAGGVRATGTDPASGQPHPAGVNSCPAHAKGAGPNERSTSPCAQRYHRAERHENHRRHAERRAGSKSIGRIARWSRESVRRNHRAGADRGLPARAPIHPEAITRKLSALPEADVRLRPRDGAAKTKPLAPPKVRRKKPFSNEPNFDLRACLYRIFGVDLTAVPGISVLTAHAILSEIGPDLSKFRSASAFASWLGLCPHNDISGGKILSTETRHVNNRAALAFRMAANALFRSQSPLGDFFRRMRAKLGAPKAITAAAHKLARIVFHMLSTRQAYDETILGKNERQYLARAEARLRAQAKALGYKVVAATA